jgi:hypothetical protein
VALVSLTPLTWQSDWSSVKPLQSPTDKGRSSYHLQTPKRAQQDAAPDQCSCNTGPMTTNHAHVLQDCPLREALRKDIWPNGVNLQNQMYGDRVDMHRTAEYIRRAGLTVIPSGRTSGQMTVSLQDQLYGDRADMHRTAEYIRRARLTVKPSGRTSGQMVSTYRTNCTVTEQICIGQRSIRRADWLWSPQEGHLAKRCQPTGPTVRWQSRYA